jgi:hypothetical protein
MIHDWINIMIEKKRLKLNMRQKIWHYSIVGYLFFIPCLLGYSLIEINITKTYSGVRPQSELIYTSLPFLILGIAYIFIQKNRLRFKEFQIKYSKDDFQEAIRRTIDEYNWQIEFNDDYFFRAYHKDFWASSTGEMITIIKQENKILINSIAILDIRNSASFGWNKKNIRIFLNNISNTVGKIPYVTLEEREKNEGPFKWKFTYILQRFIIYGLSVFFFALSFCNFNSKGVIVTRIIAILIAGFYFYFVDYNLIKTLKKRQ